MNRAVDVVHALFSAVVIAAIAVGVPCLLVLAAANPWPGRAALEMRNEVAILGGLITAVAWLVWARLTALLGTELVRQAREVAAVRAANRRRSPGTRPVVVEPIVDPSPGLGVLAQRLIATLLIVVPLWTKSPRMVDAAPPLPAVAPVDPVEVRATDRPDVTPVARHVGEPSPRLDEVTVGPNETLRSLARDHLGDPGRWREIFDLNVARTQVDGRRLTSPSAVQAGWQLRLPRDAVRTAERNGSADRHAELASTPASEPAAVPAGLPPEVVTIEAGDTLWALSEHRLEQIGRPDAAATVDYVGRVAATNRVVVEDPHLIYPGEKITLPAIGRQPAQEAPPPSPERERPERPEQPDRPAARPERERPERPQHPDRPERPASEAPDTADVPAPTTPVQADDDPLETQPTVAQPATSNEEPPPLTVPGSLDDVEGTSGDPFSPTAFGAGALAIGVLAVVDSRRRRRLRSSSVTARLPQRPAALVDTERSLRKLDSPERHARLDLSLRSAAASMVGGHERIRIVTIDARGGVTIITSGPVSLARPWRSHDDGPASSRWDLPAAVPIEDLAPTGRQFDAPCVALALVGATDSGAQVYVDLESVGSLAVVGRDAAAEHVVCAIAAGLASQVLAESAHLVGIGVPATAFLRHPNHHVVESVDEAFELAGDLLGSDAERDETFRLRARHTSGRAWEPVVLFVAARHGDDLRAEVVPARVAAVVAEVAPDGVTEPASEDMCPEGDVRIVQGSAAWTLQPHAIELDPVGLSSSELEQIDQLIDADVVLDGDGPRADVGVLADGNESGRADNGDATEATDDDGIDERVEDWDILVRVMGLVDVIDRDGNTGEFTKSKSLELLAWAATHRDRSTRQGARTALWDVDVRDATFANIVSEARRALARMRNPADGHEWLARTMNATLRLDERVTTDAEVIAASLRRARRQAPAAAVTTLRSAAELIRGVPFADSAYLWPDAEGITSQMVVLATSCCGQLAQRLLDADDHEGVFWATGQGLKVLPGHEELIGLRMRAHARKGDRSGVRQEWETYERVVLADPWSDGEPAPCLVKLRRELLAPAAGD